MLEWIDGNLPLRPPDRRVIRNILPVNAKTNVTLSHSVGSFVPVSELVFFGRLEVRKGIELFCDAVDSIMTQGLSSPRPSVISFLGRCGRIGGEHAAAYVLRRSCNWPVELHFEIAADQHQALEYLQRGNRLAVMPSIADNLPSVVIECLEHRIPFIAGNVGGACELIDTQDHALVLVPPQLGALVNSIVAALKRGSFVARASITRDQAAREWRQFIEEVQAGGYRTSIQDTPASLTVADTHDQSFALSECRQGVFVTKTGVHLDGQLRQAMARGLRSASVVATNWLEGDVIRVPQLDRATLLAGTPEVAACAVECSMLADYDKRLAPGDICRRAVLADSTFLIVPEPWCTVRPDGSATSLRNVSDIELGAQTRDDAWSLVAGRDYAQI